MMPTAFHPLNPNPFIHYYHGTLPPLLLGNDIGFDLYCTESAAEHRQTYSCLTYRGFASLHRLPVFLLPVGDYAVLNTGRFRSTAIS